MFLSTTDGPHNCCPLVEYNPFACALDQQEKVLYCVIDSSGAGLGQVVVENNGIPENKEALQRRLVQLFGSLNAPHYQYAKNNIAEAFNAVDALDDGSVVFAGCTYGDWSGSDARKADFIAAKLDSAGSLDWRWQVGRSTRLVSISKDGVQAMFNSEIHVVRGRVV